MMFEYDIEMILAGEFERLAFFCSEKGECTLEDVPVVQAQRLTGTLNEKGAERWALGQLFFQTSGVVGVWKRGEFFST